MIYCGSSSGSYFGKVLVPVSALVPVPDPDFLAQFFNNKQLIEYLSFSVLEAVLFPRNLASNFCLFDFCITFMLDPVPVLLRQKVALRFRFC
jgi:hypothetical protein